MLRYFYDSTFDVWTVINEDHVTFAVFGTELEARDYCLRHGSRPHGGVSEVLHAGVDKGFLG